MKFSLNCRTLPLNLKKLPKCDIIYKISNLIANKDPDKKPAPYKEFYKYMHNQYSPISDLFICKINKTFKCQNPECMKNSSVNEAMQSLVNYCFTDAKQFSIQDVIIEQLKHHANDKCPNCNEIGLSEKPYFVNMPRYMLVNVQRHLSETPDKSISSPFILYLILKSIHGSVG